MPKKQKQLRRVDEIHKPKPFIRFRFRVVVFFFVLCVLVCLIYYLIIANANADNIITAARTIGYNLG